MENAARAAPGYLVVLNSSEFLIRRAIGAADASPFLAHCQLGTEQSTKLLRAYIEYVARDPERIPESFKRWPLVSVWAFAQALSKEYGEESAAVYSVLEKEFRVDFPNHIRTETSQRFRSVCRRYGLCYEGSDRLVNDYLVQAGIAKWQLHHVARAFLAAERAFGPAPIDNTSALNSWEDDAVRFLPQGVRIPRMVIEVDETAHYAFLFARHRRKERYRNPAEQEFFAKLDEAEAERGPAARAQSVPRPGVVWTDSGPCLSIPRVEGRATLTIQGENLRVRGGQNWPVMMPWPDRIGFAVGDYRETVSLFSGPDSILVFDNETKRLVGPVSSMPSRQCQVDSRDVTLAARLPFNVNGEPAFLLGTSSYCFNCSLGSDGASIEIDGRTLTLKAKPKPRVWVEEGTLGSGSTGALVSIDGTIGVETGESGEDYDLAVLEGKVERIIELPRSRDCSVDVRELLGARASSQDLEPLRLELRMRGSKRALVRQKVWVWPSLSFVSDGFIFESATVPPSFSPERSRHVFQDQSGRLCLEPDGAYDTALLCFLIGAERVEFEFPKPGIGFHLMDATGQQVPLKIGEPLVLRDEDKAGSLCIRATDSRAGLNIRGRIERDAFERTSTRVLSLAELMVPAASDEVTLLRGDNVPLVLTRIMPAASPSGFKSSRVGSSTRLQIEMPADFDAVRLHVEDELGARADYECAVMHRPVEGQTPAWMTAQLDTGDTRRVHISIDPDRYQGPFALAQIQIRPLGSDTFRPLRNARGDSYGIALRDSRAGAVETVTYAGQLTSRFSTLNGWMAQCFARECWDLIGPQIQPRWMTLGDEIRARPEGKEIMLAAAFQQRMIGSSRTWVPLAHPLQIDQDIFSVPAQTFLSLAANDADGADHVAMLGEVAGRSIPDLHRDFGVSHAFLAAFSNIIEAQRTGAELTGFQFERFVKAFEDSDVDAGARWFWRPGERLLGPEHYGAALGRLVDRIYDAGFDEEGANDFRFRQVTALAHEAHKHSPRILPLPHGLEDTHALIEWAPAFLSSFALNCRRGTARQYLQNYATALGRPYLSLVGDASFLIRLAPELLAFYLILWELTERQSK